MQNSSYKVLYRSNYELNETKDYDLSIVFSATAFDCELSRLHHKWREINSIIANEQLAKDELDKLLRTHGNVKSKIDNISKLMFPKGFEPFVASEGDFKEIISEGFPSLNEGNLLDKIVGNLFWPRNEILHQGKGGYDKDDAVKCFNISRLCISIVTELDYAKRKRT